MSVPRSSALTSGQCWMASTVARMMNGRNEAFTP